MSLFTEDIADMALELATPMILSLFDKKVTKRNDLHVVVAVRHESSSSDICSVLAEASFGDRNKWEFPFDDIAFKKTLISARTGLTSRQVQLMQPELLVPEDTLFWGNAILGDIIVSASGVQPWFDEAICNAIAWQCRALVQQKTEFLREEAQGNEYDS